MSHLGLSGFLYLKLVCDQYIPARGIIDYAASQTIWDDDSHSPVLARAVTDDDDRWQASARGISSAAYRPS